MKKLIALVLALAMILMVGAAFAKTNGTATDGTGSITIANASKGETYKVFKLFDATVSAGGINYTGTIPEELEDYFVQDTAGNISANEEKTAQQIATAVQSYVSGLADNTAVRSDTGDGTPLTFAGLAYGYYGVKSSQGATVTIDSTNPNATIYDKNTTTVTASKTVEHETYSIGDTINYTATFDTTNYKGSDSTAQQVIDYVISDTLPEFLSGVAVDSIVVDQDGDLTTTTDQVSVTAQFNSSKQITIAWADEVTPATTPRTWTSKYANGSKIVMTYHGTLTSVTNINGNDTNTVKIIAHVADDDGNPQPWDENWEDDAVIKTYAAALKKTDGTNPLPGAQFTIKGLTVTGSAGEYTVVSYSSAADAAESAVLDTNADGKLYIIGLASDVSLTVTEYKAPDGYNKLTETKTITPQILTEKIYKASGTIKYDAKGNVIASEASATTTETVSKNLTDLDAAALEIVNNAGTELPSTGGIGTTIFYILGGLLVVGAAVILVARRRVHE